MSLFCFPLALSQFLGAVRGGIEKAATGDEYCCRMSGWAVVCPVHEASWPGSQRRVFRLDVSLLRFFLDVSQTISPSEWMNAAQNGLIYSGCLKRAAFPFVRGINNSIQLNSIGLAWQLYQCWTWIFQYVDSTEEIKPGICWAKCSFINK